MSFKKNNTIDIYIDDSEFDEENVGTISVCNNNDEKVGIRISTLENGTAEIYLDFDEVKCLISAFKIAIKSLRDVSLNSHENSRINIMTLNIVDIDLNKSNDGIILVNTFNYESIGICISLTKGADPELWMDIHKAENIIVALEKTIINSI